MIYIGKSERGKVSLDLPTLIDTRLLIQSNSGGGKSWAIRRLLEQSHGQVQQIVLDLEGEFNTLRERFDYVLAGRNGDTSAEPRSAGLLARRLLELKVSAICDLYELKAHERVRFVRLFLESLIAAPKKLWHPVLVIVDESHHFCPERGQAESAPAVIDLITRGRKRGLCGVLATQRLSKLHKDAAAELLNKMIGRTSLDIDRKRAADELGFRKQDDSLALRDLRPGEFHAYGPAIRVIKRYAGGIISLAVGPVKTTHPTVGARHIDAPPAPTSAIKKILGKLADLPAEAEEKAKTETDLRREVAQLKRELTIQKRSRGERVVDTEQVEKWRQRASVAEKVVSESNKRITLARKQLVKLSAGSKSLSETAEHINKIFENHNETTTQIDVSAMRSMPFRQTFVPKPKPPTNVDDGISRPQQKILDSLAAYEVVGLGSVAKNAVAVYAGVSPTSGGYFNNLGALRTQGLIEYPTGGQVTLTEHGRSLADAPEMPATLDGLHDSWMRVVNIPQARILKALIDIYPNDIAKEELADRVGVSSTSGGYFNNLGRLHTLGAIDYPSRGHVRASNLLFPEGLA